MWAYVPSMLQAKGHLGEVMRSKFFLSLSNRLNFWNSLAYDKLNCDLYTKYSVLEMHIGIKNIFGASIIYFKWT